MLRRVAASTNQVPYLTEKRTEEEANLLDKAGRRAGLSRGITVLSGPIQALVLTHRAFHLQFDQPVQFDGIFHRQLLDQGLDEAADDHGAGFGFG